jgi:cyanophycinase
MAIRSLWDRSVGSPSRLLRTTLSGVVVAGLGIVLTLGAHLVGLATASPPQTAAGKLAGRGGSLVICGGGPMPDSIRERFIELAGGRSAKIIVIPTAHLLADGPDAIRDLEPWKARGVVDVELLHTRSKETANSPEFVRPLAEATGVWFSGGRQRLVTDAYLGTEVERQLKALLARGGVIGGTSAGAAVMTRVMIERGWTKPETSEGFDLLPGAVIDQHFLKRNRLSRLLTVLSEHPELIGFGIDEGTALVFNCRSRLLNVMGNSYVVVCAPVPIGKAESSRLAILKQGDELNLATLEQFGELSQSIVQGINFDAL